jgi:hypothetical protein
MTHLSLNVLTNNALDGLKNLILVLQELNTLVEGLISYLGITITVHSLK